MKIEFLKGVEQTEKHENLESMGGFEGWGVPLTNKLNLNTRDEITN